MTITFTYICASKKKSISYVKNTDERTHKTDFCNNVKISFFYFCKNAQVTKFEYVVELKYNSFTFQND